MTFAELTIGEYYYDSPGYHLKCKTGAASYRLVNHVRKLEQVEWNVNRSVRITSDREAWPPVVNKYEQVHWSED